MMPTLYYFLQVIICSAVLYGYYIVALRNKRFHQYNRFFLLGVFSLAWVIPLIKFEVRPASSAIESSGKPFRFFEVIADNNSHFEQYVSANASSFNTNELFAYGYWLVCIVMALVFIAGLIKLFMLLNTSRFYKIDNVVIVKTTIKGAPFSFFRFIFWNEAIDINSDVGKQILSHELVHVQEKHSVDKIVSGIILCVGWFNPIFWLAKRELDMVHEFIADKKSVNDDASALAHMLLTASYPSIHLSMTNSFFHSPVKRRIFMMSKLDITRQPYLRRLLVLPLFGVVVMLFAFRKQVSDIVTDNINKISTEEKLQADTPRVMVSDVLLDKQVLSTDKGVALKRVYRVMLDAGHGGYDGGAVGIDGTRESDIAMEIVKTIIEENKNEKIQILLTRESDEYLHPTLKVDLTKKNKADVLVSIHAAASENTSLNGIELFIPQKDTLPHYRQSYNLANVMANNLARLDSKVQIKRRQVGIWIIDAADRPALLVETGFISNNQDLRKLKSKSYQQQLARALLKGIEMYLQELNSVEK